jgi:hypothetical protein
MAGQQQPLLQALLQVVDNTSAFKVQVCQGARCAAGALRPSTRQQCGNS